MVNGLWQFLNENIMKRASNMRCPKWRKHIEQDSYETQNSEISI
jgi:hypothetical protein